MKKIRLGIVGLGAITQMVYLPDLEMLRDKYEITALCDASPGVLAAIGRKCPGAALCATSAELAALPTVDAVLIANSDAFHYTDTMLALESGKHVFIEKPMCFSMGEAEAIAAAAGKHNVKVLVGYVRRYSDAFHLAKKELPAKDRINYVRIRDILGFSFLFMNENTNIIRFNDIPEVLAQKGEELAKASLAEALGSHYPKMQDFYGYLAGLCCHDFSAMRGLFGMPLGVESASLSRNGLYLAVDFKYDGFHIAYEAGIDSQKRRDSTFEVFSDNKTVKIDYGCFYYLKQIPDAVQIDETIDGVFSQKRIVPTYRDPYARELEAFYDAIVSGAPIDTPPEDYMEDLRIFHMILEKVR